MRDEFLRSGSIATLKNGSVLIGWGKKTFLKEPDEKLPSWYSPDFFLKSQNPWHTHEKFEVATKPQLRHVFTPEKVRKLTFSDPHPFFMMREDLEKTVPYTSIFSSQKPSLSSLLYHLLGTDEHLHLAGTWDEKEGMIGATPELLFEMKDSSVISEAVAGTSLADDQTALLNSEKNIEENDYVVKSIVSSFGEIAKIRLMPKKTKNFFNICHIVTPIEISLDKKLPFSEIVPLFHPTSAVGTFPKNWEWLERYESRHPRKKYGAPFGYSLEEVRVFVAIRNIQWDEKGSQIFAGCGVTDKSRYDDEWNEALLKLESIKTCLGL